MATGYDGNQNALKYKAAICNKLPELFVNGESIEEACVTLKIDRKTYYNWIDKYPAFAAAAEQAALVSAAWWLKTGREGATDGSINAPVWIFNMKNRLGWKDKIENSGEQNIKVTISKDDADTV